MLDPEALLIKGAILILASLSIVRLVLHDYNKIVVDFRKRRRRRRPSLKRAKATEIV
jgi:hypothetical protein